MSEKDYADVGSVSWSFEWKRLGWDSPVNRSWIYRVLIYIRDAFYSIYFGEIRNNNHTKVGTHKNNASKIYRSSIKFVRDNFIFVLSFHLILFRTNFNSSTCNLIVNKYFSISSFQIFQNCSINILTPYIECRYDGAGGWRGPEGGSPADTNSDSGTVAQFVFVGPCGRFVVVEFSYQN